MYKKILRLKENVINGHIQKLNEFEREKRKSEDKIHNAYQELKDITYNNESTFFEIQSKILYLRDYISTLKKEVNFYDNYIEHENKTILSLNVELEKFKYLQSEVELEKKRRIEQQEEEELLELLTMKRNKI